MAALVTQSKAGAILRRKQEVLRHVTADDPHRAVREWEAAGQRSRARCEQVQEHIGAL